MTAAADPLTTLAESLADGEPIDWDALGALAGDSELRALLDHLRVVAGVAEVHRTQSDEADDPAAPFELPAHADGDSMRWGHLSLVRKLGQGAFGEVYLAHDTWLDHPRALKLLKPDVATRLSPEQLLNEARKLVRVRHPNVVAVHGADRHDGRVGFWMDFVDGVTLADLVAEQCLDAEQATRIGRELCEALEAVHGANLIHRDIKTQNVMRTADGRIVLMDFGAGEFIGTSPRGRPQGTPLYLAPELFDGGAASVQSDVYAVGVLLYHLVTGSFPVQAGSVTELIDAHAKGAGIALRELHPELPDGFLAAIDRALDPEPSRRFGSAGEMRDALASLLTEAVDESSLVPATSRAWLYLSRSALAVAALTATTGVVGYLGWRTFQLALHVEPVFSPSVGEYFRLGREAMLPFLLYWTAGVAVFALLRGLDTVVGGPVVRLVQIRTAALSASEVTRLAAALCLGAVLAWSALIARHWTLFDTLFGLQFRTAGVSTGTLGPAFRAWNFSYGNLSALLTGALLGTAMYVFPALERQRSDRSGIRPFTWAALVVAFLILCSAVATRRLAWDRFEEVVYENHRAFVIASSGDDLLLYEPTRPQDGSVRVHRGSPLVTMTGRNGLLIDP